MAELTIGTARLILVQGDITRQDADAAVVAHLRTHDLPEEGGS